MRIDLHTHTNRSDGTTSPAELVRHARDKGIDVLAVTDHDTTEGWAEATEAAVREGVVLVRGMEISCKLAGHGVHLLAYLPDPTFEPLAAELERILDGRNSRLPATLAKLRDLGIDIDVADVRRRAGGAAAIGRPHVADALVDKGVVRDRTEAFDRYLGPQGPAYTHRYAADLFAMIEHVKGAGGVSVVAHPWASRHNYDALGAEGLATLKGAGLAGVEVDHQDHDAETRQRLRATAVGLDLLITGSSDYHGDGKVDHEVGCNTTSPDEYERLVALAERSAAASGRVTPAIVGS
ncbi:MAG TPA: PHP domain-containing protein [Nocardioidaceae bacterium]|nr:PHP domain-containing protein [Nocardioidaceae bacterium]